MKWTTLRHNGVAFPPEYEYRGLAVKIKGRTVKLEPAVEEMLMAWAKKKDTPYVQDPVFQRNFLGSLTEALPADLRDITLDDIDWSELHWIAESEKTANLSPEEKKKRSLERKAVREELKAKFGTAVIDDDETEIGAYMVEPPGILMGRGEHPLRGKWKRRVQPEDVILNLDQEAPEPPALEGHHWGKIVHEHDSMWIASWWDELAGKRKYVWLADSSSLRQERDKEKYVKAAKLESNVDKVRAEIRKRMEHSDSAAHAKLERSIKKLSEEITALERRVLRATQAGDTAGRQKFEDPLDRLRKEREQLEKRRDKVHGTGMKTRQLATVCYLIDKLAMRVGDEKDEDEADTVGASTLRVEHVIVHDDRVEFDFLGKDSVQWQKIIPLNDGERVLARNLQEFMEGKRRGNKDEPGDQVFDKIDSTHVNQFLSSIVPGLTAKVFRTFHATTMVRNCLKENGNLRRDVPAFEKEYTAKLANLQAAIMCNHKRTPPKNWEESLKKKEETVEKLREAAPNLDKLRSEIPGRTQALEKLIREQEKFVAEAPRLVEQKERALAELREKPLPDDAKEAARLNKQREAAAQAVEKTRADVAKKTARFAERLEKAREALEKAREAPERAQREYEERVAKAKRALDLAKATRDYNLGTSLKNYIDPRVYKAWGDHVDYDWKRLYTKALQRKFAWVNHSHVRWNAGGVTEAALVADAENIAEVPEDVSGNGDEE